MQQYDQYKDSGIEWIGNIPAHWEVKKIKHECYVKARVGWKGLKSTEFLSTGYSYLVTGSDFINNEVEWQKCYHIDKKRYNEDPYIQLKEKDLLITKDGTIGKLAIVSNLDKPACLNSGIFVVRALAKSLNTYFLFWVLKSKSFIQYNDLTKYGSTIQHLYQNVFVEFSFPLPPPKEQTAIANYLDRKTAAIDQLIANKKRLIELYKEEKAAVINQAVTKGINPNAPMKDSSIKWLGDIPAHWEVKKLKYFSKIILGKMLTSKDKGGYYLKPYLRAANIDWIKVKIEDVKKMWFSEQELIKYKLKKNDLLVSEGGEVGRTCIWNEELEECYLQNSVHKITVDSNSNPIYYLYHFLVNGNKGVFDFITNRISIAHLTVEKLKEIKFITPSLSEQTQIVQYIQKETQRLDAKIQEAQAAIRLYTEYRAALISEVVTGQLKVTDE